MKKSQDSATQKFIDNIAVLDTTKYQILQRLRDIVFDNTPSVKERIMYGGIMLALNTDFGGIFVYDKHISFEFSNGFKFTDTNNVLEGTGKYRRHLKFKSLEDIETKNAVFFIKQALVAEK